MVANGNKHQLNILPKINVFFPFGEGYIKTKSQAININGIIKAEKEQKIYILKRTSIYF